MAEKLDVVIDEKAVADVAVVRLKGSLDMYSYREFRETMDAWIGRTERPRILVDMGGLVYVGSSGWSALLTLASAAKRKGGRLVAYGANEHMRKTLALITSKNRILCLVPGYEEAQKALRDESAPEEPQEEALVEKRQHERIPTNWPVLFKEIDEEKARKLVENRVLYDELFHNNSAAGDFSEKPGLKRAMAANVSLSGVQLNEMEIIGDELSKKGAILALEIEVIDKPFKVRTTAKVVWVSISEQHEGRFSAGLSFIAINAFDAAKIEQYIALRKQKH